jgi:stage V sporulation protein G
MANEQTAIKLDVRAYPIAEPKSNTVAFASVTINDMIAINGIRVVEGSNGLFAAMPQAKDNNGDYRDIAFPVTKELRQQLNKAILDEYAIQKDQPEKASVKEQIKDGVKSAPAAAPEAGKGKSTKKTGPEH